jgi:hypothetical protein
VGWFVCVSLCDGGSGGGGGGGGPWQELGTVVSLINGGDQVAIGTLVPFPGVKLDVFDTVGLTGARFVFGPFRFLRIGSLDAFAREQLWFTGTDGILRLGADTSDGDPFDKDSEGIVVYHPTGDQLGRMKADRFALTRASESALNYYRVDQTRLFYSSNPTSNFPAAPTYPIGSVHFWVDRATGFVGIRNLAAGFPGPAGAEIFRVGGDARVDGKLTVTGAIDPVSLRLSDPALGTALYLESADGQTAPVSALNEGRIRYNTALQQWEHSDNGGAYVPFGGGGGAPDGYYLTYNAAAPANAGSVFKDWPVLQAMAALLVAAGSSFRVWIASDLTFPVGPSLIGDGLFAGLVDPAWFVDVPDGVTWSPTALDATIDGSLLVNFRTTATRVIDSAALRLIVSNAAILRCGIGATIAPIRMFGGGGEGVGLHRVELATGAQIQGGGFGPAVVIADSDDTSIEVYVSSSGTFLESSTFESAGTGVLTIFIRDPAVRTGTFSGSDQSATWAGGPVKYQRRLFPFVGQLAADGGTSLASTSVAERRIARVEPGDSWLDQINLSGRLAFSLRCTAQAGAVTARVRIRVGIFGTLWIDFGAVIPVLGGVLVFDARVRTDVPGAAGMLDTWGTKTAVPFDGIGAMVAFGAPFGPVDLDFLIFGFTITVEFSAIDGGANVIRCDGALLDVGGVAVGVP